MVSLTDVHDVHSFNGDMTSECCSGRIGKRKQEGRIGKWRDEAEIRSKTVPTHTVYAYQLTAL